MAWKHGISCGVLELQGGMDRCTGRRDITEILMKTALNTIKSINPVEHVLFCLDNTKITF